MEITIIGLGNFFFTKEKNDIETSEEQLSNKIDKTWIQTTPKVTSSRKELKLDLG